MDAAEEWLDVPQVRRCFYLCQGGYVSVGVSSFVRLYVCRITQKTTRPVFAKCRGKVADGPRKRRLDFKDNLDHVVIKTKKRKGMLLDTAPLNDAQ